MQEELVSNWFSCSCQTQEESSGEQKLQLYEMKSSVGISAEAADVDITEANWNTTERN